MLAGDESETMLRWGCEREVGEVLAWIGAGRSDLMIDWFLAGNSR